MSDLTADIYGLVDASRRFHDAADDVKTAYDRIAAHVDGRDASVWGSDEPGGVFGSGYEKAHRTAMTTLADIHQRLVAAAEGVSDSAETLAHHDQNIASDLKSAGS